MTRYVLRLFGYEILSLETVTFELVEEDEAGETEVAGGSSHNFERDFDPPTPGTEKDYDSWVERPFGFRRP